MRGVQHCTQEQKGTKGVIPKPSVCTYTQSLFGGSLLDPKWSVGDPHFEVLEPVMGTYPHTKMHVLRNNAEVHNHLPSPGVLQDAITSVTE